MTNDHIFLQTVQEILLSAHRCFVQNLRGLLERRRGDEGLGLQRCTRDALQQRTCGCWNGVSAFGHRHVTSTQRAVHIAQLTRCNHLAQSQVFAVSCIGDNHHAEDAVVFLHEVRLLSELLLEESCISSVFDDHLLHHLSYDDLEVLVVDLYPLQAVNVLDFIHDVLLNRGWAHHVEDVDRRDSSIGKRHTGSDKIIVLNEDVLRERHHVLVNVTTTRFHDDFAVTPLDLSVGNDAVNFRNNRWVGRVTRFKQFRHTRQTPCDVTGLTGHTWNLRQDLSNLRLVPFFNRKVSAHRQRVRLQHLTLLVDDEDCRVLLLVLGLSDDNLTETGLFVQLLAVGHAFLDHVKLDQALFLVDDHIVVGVPSTNGFALLDLVTRELLENRTVWQDGRAQGDSRLRIDHLEFRRTRNHYGLFLAFCVGSGHFTQVVNLNDPVKLDLHLVFIRNLRCRTTHVERTQRQLSTRFTDGLCRNDTNGLTHLHRARSSKVLAVALHAYA